MNLGGEKRSKNLTNRLWLSMHFTKSFKTIDDVSEPGVHLSNSLRFFHLEHFVLSDKEIYFCFLHSESALIGDFQFIPNLLGCSTHAEPVEFISRQATVEKSDGESILSKFSFINSDSLVLL